MGATVSTGKMVAAFAAASGTPFYVLFEETFEKNCVPHTPRWSCYAIGSLESVMRSIFIAGSNCEGGMLKGAGGRDITPEGYIAGWLKELANPMMLSDRAITLEAGDSWRSAIPTEQLEKTKAKLVSLGRHDIATALEQKQPVSLSLHGDCELLGSLYEGNSLGPWRIISSSDTPLYGTRSPSLGYEPSKAKVFDLAVPRFYKINEKDSNCLIQGNDGEWQCAGWAYSCVASYVAHLWEAELREPGSYRTRIKAYRDAIKAAPNLPKHGVKIVIDTSVGLGKWQQSSLDALTAKVAHTRAGSVIRMDVPTDEGLLYSATHLPMDCTKWVITESAPFEQLSLLAG